MKASDIERLALALPKVEQKPHFGSRSYRVGGKIFLQTNADKNEAVLKLSAPHQEMLFETRPDVFRAEVWGSLRWTRVRLDGLSRDEAVTLLREAYDQVASGKKEKAAGKIRRERTAQGRRP